MWVEKPPSRKQQLKKEDRGVLADDSEGTVTLDYLNKVKRVASRISGDHSRSLGLHPAIYFYGATGKFQPPSLLATVRMIQEMEQRDSFVKFTGIRQKYEEFLFKYKHFTNQIVGDYGGGTRGVEPLLEMYSEIQAGLEQSSTQEEIVTRLLSHQNLKRRLKEISEPDRLAGRNFSTETKSAVYLRQAIESAPRCGICGARVHLRGISVDHIVPKRDGGIGSLDNAQLSHPYCNSGYKEHLTAEAQKLSRGLPIQE